MATLAMMGAMMSSCAEEIEVAQPANTGNTVMVKTTVSLDENATTRALTSNGEKTFAVGEQIAVIYENTSNQTVKAVSEALALGDIDTDNTHKATFKVPLINPNPGGDVRYIYPASMVADNVSATTPDNDATIKWTNLTTQDGTLAKLSSYFDLATFDGNLTESGTLPATASLVNPLTIGKFTIKNSGGTDITSSITGLNISDGTNIYAVSRETADGPIYVAMKPITSTQTVAVNVTDGTNHYTKTVTENYALVASNIYDIAVTINSTPGANLSAVAADYTAKNGEVLTGTLGSNVKISIAAGATVTLNGVTINGVNNSSYNWAGITCEGDATIILADGSTNTVKGFSSIYPGIFVPEGKTLIIQGDGSLYASNNGGESAGIGAGYGNNCGNIEIQGGNITATSSEGAGIGAGQMGKCGNITISGGTITATSSNGAGIGGGAGGTSVAGQCGNITISGGTITATSSNSGAGIGGGDEGPCGDITITNGVTKVTATKGSSAQQCIGKGESSDCGTVTVDGVASWSGTSTTNLTCTTSGNTLTLNRYPLLVAKATLSSVDIGKVLAADGKIYADAASANTNGGGAQVVIAYVGSVPNYFDKFLAIAIDDVDGSKHSWSDAVTAVGTYAAAHAITIGSTTYNTNVIGNNRYDHVENNVNKSSATRTDGVLKGWRLPSVTDWRYIFDGLGRQKKGLILTAKDRQSVYSTNATPTDPLGAKYLMAYYGSISLCSVINEACGNSALQSNIYWSSSQCVNYMWGYTFDEEEFSQSVTSIGQYARAVFAY